MSNSANEKLRQTKKDFDLILKKKQAEPKLLNAKKFAGKLKWEGDPVKLQREWRDE
jgi:hypothetical protein